MVHLAWVVWLCRKIVFSRSLNLVLHKRTEIVFNRFGEAPIRSKKNRKGVVLIGYVMIQQTEYVVSKHGVGISYDVSRREGWLPVAFSI